MAVTNANKTEYVHHYIQWRVTRGTTQQMEAYLHGVREIISLDLLRVFDPKELEVCAPGAGKTGKWPARAEDVGHRVGGRPPRWRCST